MFEKYKTQIAIIIGSIIIAATIFYTSTYEKRAKYNWCLELQKSEFKERNLKPDKKDLKNIKKYCYLEIYISSNL